MNQMVSITARVDAAASTLIEDAARIRGISSADYVAEAVRRGAESDADYRAFIQVGLDAESRGDVVSHEQVMAEPGAMIAGHPGRCAS